MFLGRRLQGIWVGEHFSSVSPVEFLTWFFFVLVFFFVVRSAHFGWFFQDTRLSTEVTGFFQSSSLQPWPCWFFMLDAWPRRSLPRPALVGHGLSSKTRLVVLRWFWGLSADFCCRGGHQWWHVFYTLRQRRRRFLMPVPFLASVLGCFSCFFTVYLCDA
jgi:hypothetical protein